MPVQIIVRLRAFAATQRSIAQSWMTNRALVSNRKCSRRERMRLSAARRDSARHPMPYASRHRLITSSAVSSNFQARRIERVGLDLRRDVASRDLQFNPIENELLCAR
jgi:hypothetical protein